LPVLDAAKVADDHHLIEAAKAWIICRTISHVKSGWDFSGGH
jgi:hypothetical protein